ncbi:hypothetical protein EST38_g4811 [Candolleomyces aberdarensis]|uniref:G-patch domain-containing protein n=1 Tax=Candolleomyces aberdarensis TaxID=2316362 RepID=A0A4Q2DM43_9AGAR|nr:hypothetical protein EST38_g4811 [Candolleomyces aberdarensis]
MSSDGGYPNEYVPSYEWPGPVSEEAEPNLGTTSTSFLRLVAVNSAILPSKHKVAILTGYPEIQFGRDKPASGAIIPRIRLREMEVSKIHSTAYWNGAEKEWALVDMGSVHGTFWQSGQQMDEASEPTPGPSKVRLSPSRVASLPRPLQHLDHVTIGSTTFSIHIHDDELPCLECASASNEIPLFHDTRTTKVAAAKATDPTGHQEAGQVKTNPKKSLEMLKKSLLQQHSYASGPISSSQRYTDRAERRRQMHGSLPPPPPALGPQRTKPRLERATPPPVEPVSDPPQQISSSNVGHHLLTKMGWQPGETLGHESDGANHLLEPIQVKHSANRAGLGVSSAEVTAVGGSGTWREQGKRKQYERLGSMS